MKILKKIVNGIIFVCNLFSYMGHLESQRYSKKYDGYDFSKDIKNIR